jgi:predicted peroxiredoxin
MSHAAATRLTRRAPHRRSAGDGYRLFISEKLPWPSEEVSVKVLYLATSGAGDPTKASLPLHIAANGSVEADQVCAVVLAGDATELILRETADRIEGVGIPPARELLQKLFDNAVPVYVWKACAVARGATDEDLMWMKAHWTTPPELARMIEQFDRIVSL